MRFKRYTSLDLKLSDESAVVCWMYTKRVCTAFCFHQQLKIKLSLMNVSCHLSIERVFKMSTSCSNTMEVWCCCKMRHWPCQIAVTTCFFSLSVMLLVRRSWLSGFWFQSFLIFQLILCSRLSCMRVSSSFPRFPGKSRSLITKMHPMTLDLLIKLWVVLSVYI